MEGFDEYFFDKNEEQPKKAHTPVAVTSDKLRKLGFYGLVWVACLFMILGFAVKRDASTAIKAAALPATTLAPLRTAPANMQNTALPPTSNPAPKPTATVTPARGVIIVDAGHGGFDPGTQGMDSPEDSFEKDINLAIALYLQEILEDEGYTVIMTRKTDKALSNTKEGDMTARVDLINEYMDTANVFVSIHQNSYPQDRGVRGPEVYYNPNNEKSGSELAQYIQSALDDKLRVTKSRGIRSADDRVTRPMPQSVLVECGFLSNSDEEALLITPEYQKVLAEAIFNGIEDYLTAKNII